MNQTEYWDKELKPFLQELHEKFDTTDKLSQWHLGQALFYVEHDLADGRDPRLRVWDCQTVFSRKSFQDIAEFADFKEDIATAGVMMSKFMYMENAFKDE